MKAAIVVLSLFAAIMPAYCQGYGALKDDANLLQEFKNIQETVQAHRTKAHLPRVIRASYTGASLRACAAHYKKIFPAATMSEITKRCEMESDREERIGDDYLDSLKYRTCVNNKPIQWAAWFQCLF